MTNTPAPLGPIAQFMKHHANGHHITPTSPQTAPQAQQKEDWTGLRGKTAWDWLNLLGVFLVPLMIGVGTLWMTNQQVLISQEQHRSDQAIAADQQRATILKIYMDDMTQLLLHEGLQSSQADAAIRHVAEAKTLVALSQLDQDRKGELLLFLYKIRLIGYMFLENNRLVTHSAVISLASANLVGTKLSRADLSGVNLSGADLYGADLFMVNLSGADLHRTGMRQANLGSTDLSKANLSQTDLSETRLYGTHLQGANLQRADLQGANLLGTDLQGADLRWANLERVNVMRTYQLEIELGINLQGANLQGANLQQANLRGADLQGADLREANLGTYLLLPDQRINLGAHLQGTHLRGAKVTREQLAKAKYLKDATLPDGSRYPSQSYPIPDHQE